MAAAEEMRSERGERWRCHFLRVRGAMMYGHRPVRSPTDRIQESCVHLQAKQRPQDTRWRGHNRASRFKTGPRIARKVLGRALTEINSRGLHPALSPSWRKYTDNTWNYSMRPIFFLVRLTKKKQVAHLEISKTLRYLQ